MKWVRTPSCRLYRQFIKLSLPKDIQNRPFVIVRRHSCSTFVHVRMTQTLSFHQLNRIMTSMTASRQSKVTCAWSAATAVAVEVLKLLGLPQEETLCPLTNWICSHVTEIMTVITERIH